MINEEYLHDMYGGIQLTRNPENSRQENWIAWRMSTVIYIAYERFEVTCEQLAG
jgi:hypothetical protein